MGWGQDRAHVLGTALCPRRGGRIVPTDRGPNRAHVLGDDAVPACWVPAPCWGAGGQRRAPQTRWAPPSPWFSFLMGKQRMFLVRKPVLSSTPR